MCLRKSACGIICMSVCVKCVCVCVCVRAYMCALRVFKYVGVSVCIFVCVCLYGMRVRLWVLASLVLAYTIRVARGKSRENDNNCDFRNCSLQNCL